MGLKKWVVSILGPLFLAGCQSDPVALPASYTLIDVRTQEEYAEGHLKGAVLIPYNSIREKIAALPRQSQIFVYCRSGRRSSIAHQTLSELGYTNVVNLGSLGAAKQKTRLPVVRAEENVKRETLK